MQVEDRLMTTVEYHFGVVDSLAPPSLDRRIPTPVQEEVDECDDFPTSESGQPLNRLQQVRRQQEMSMRSVARQTGVSVRILRKQENANADLRISDLRKWQKALDVPMGELLEAPGTQLSAPVMERARFVRLMKTASAIAERAESEGIQRMAQMMVDQLTDLMPELEGVTPWHAFGQRRGLDELGCVVDRRLRDDVLYRSCRSD
jgi:transcriptional regulator with XRE-family HTH domain